jgi:probable addiction module antidote protein
MTKVRRFDVAELLDSDADIQDFLTEAAQAGTASEFLHALNIAARARGMSEVAKQSGVTRASLYKSLAEGANPEFETVFRVCAALGVKLIPQPNAA